MASLKHIYSLPQPSPTKQRTDLATCALEQTSQTVTYRPFSFLSINNYTIPILHHRHYNAFLLHSEDSYATSLVAPTLTLTHTHVRSRSCSYSISHSHTPSLAHTFKHISTLEHVPDPFVLTGARVHTRSRCASHATSPITFTLHWRVYSPRLMLNVGSRWMQDVALVIEVVLVLGPALHSLSLIYTRFLSLLFSTHCGPFHFTARNTWQCLWTWDDVLCCYLHHSFRLFRIGRHLPLYSRHNAGFVVAI